MSFSGKYIRKVFSLKKFLFPNLFVSMRVVANQGYVLLKCICWKIFEQIGICIAYFHVFYNYITWNSYSCRGGFRTLSNIYAWAFFKNIDLRKKALV